MLVKIFIKRRFKKGKVKEINALLRDFRSGAMTQSGYVSGETLVSCDDPRMSWSSGPGRIWKAGWPGRTTSAAGISKPCWKCTRRGPPNMNPMCWEFLPSPDRGAGNLADGRSCHAAG